MQIVAKQGGLFKTAAKKATSVKKSVAPRKSSSSGE